MPWAMTLSRVVTTMADTMVSTPGVVDRELLDDE
jgi:hypothetical protein